MRADGAIAWKTSLLGRLKDLALGSDDALYGYVMGSRPIAPWTSAVVHGFRFDPATGAGTKLFSEEIGSNRMPRTITPLPDGHVQFSVPADPLEYPESVTPSANLRPEDQDAVGRDDEHLDAVAPRHARGRQHAHVAHDLRPGPVAPALLGREARRGRRALVEDRQRPAPRRRPSRERRSRICTGQYGDGGPAAPATARGRHARALPLATPKSGSPWTMAVGPDDALVLGHRKSASPRTRLQSTRRPARSSSKRPSSSRAATSPSMRPGTSTAAAPRSAPTGARLEAPAKPWVPALDRVAVGPNGTLFAAWTRPNSTGTICRLVEHHPLRAGAGRHKRGSPLDAGEEPGARPRREPGVEVLAELLELGRLGDLLFDLAERTPDGLAGEEQDRARG